MALMLANDDGINAPGLNVLAELLKKAGQSVLMIAPDRDRSGASHSLTLDRPLNPIEHESGRMSVDGTPADCVHLGVHAFYQHRCERVIAGINAGANLGDDVLYSGTVAAAAEGRFLKKTPIAISLVGKTHFVAAAQVVLDLLPRIDDLALPTSTLININVPDLPFEQLKGIQITRLGRRQPPLEPVPTTNPRGKQSYWISVAGGKDDDGEGTDFYAVEQGFISITPINLDMTAHHQIDEIQSLLADTRSSS